MAVGRSYFVQEANRLEHPVLWDDLCVELERVDRPQIKCQMHQLRIDTGRQTSAMAKYSINIERMFMPKISMIAKSY